MEFMCHSTWCQKTDLKEVQYCFLVVSQINVDQQIQEKEFSLFLLELTVEL